jgi:PAS domain-containing protein
MIGAIRDVTRDLEAERALHEAAELYRTLFENAVNSAFQIAEDGRF